MAERVEKPGLRDERVVPGAWRQVRDHPKVIPLVPRPAGRAGGRTSTVAPPTMPWTSPPQPRETPWPAPACPAWSAPSGGELRRLTGWGGSHRLLVRNRTRLDAVVTIASPSSVKRPYVASWVGAGESTIINGIAAGTYNVVFDLGEVWDGTAFSREGRRLQFVEALRFAPLPRTGSTLEAWEAVLREGPRPPHD